MLLARAAAGLSRLVGRRRGHDGARQAALEARSRRGRPARRSGFRAGRRSSPRRTARRRPRRWRREILGPAYRLAHNRSGANLVSGVASALLAAPDAQLGLFEVDEAALPEVARRLQPRAVCLGNLFRDQLDRYGELELVAARWRETVAALPERAALVVNGDDPQVGDLARSRPAATCSALDDPRHAAPGSAARGRLEVVRPLRDAVRLRGRVRRPSRRLPLPELRPRAAAARPRRAREIELHGLERRRRSTSSPRTGARRVELALPGSLQRLQRARGRGARAGARRRASRTIVAGLERFRRRSAASSGSRSATGRCCAADQEPGRRERGRPRRSSPGGAPRLRRDRAERRRSPTAATSRGSGTSTSSRSLGGLERVVATGDRAAELALRFKYGGLPADRIEVVPELERALDRGLELTPAGGELVVLPDLHGDARAARDRRASAGYVRHYWERAA